MNRTLHSKRLNSAIRSLCIILSLCTFKQTQGATINITSNVRGKTPTYMGFNPGTSGGYVTGKHYGNPDEYGTHAFWIRQSGANMMRLWGRAQLDEGSIDARNCRERNDTNPPGDGVTNQNQFDAARQAVISDPLGNSYIRWDRFNHIRIPRLMEEQDLGLTSVQVMRHKHGGSDNFPGFMGGDGIPSAERDPNLEQIEHQWEWWEHCFALAYINSKYTGSICFELGNEPELGQQGGISIDGQKTATRLGIDAIREAVRAATGQEAFVMSCGSGHAGYVEAIANEFGDQLDVISVHVYAGDAQGHIDNFNEMLNAVGDRTMIISEQGADANESQQNPYDLGITLFTYLHTADPRLDGVLLFKTASAADDKNAILNPNVQMGLFQPWKGYYIIRMLYRAGLNKKDVLTTSSSDNDLKCVVSKDSEKTFITIHNSGNSSKSYSVSPAGIQGSIQHVFLWDNGSHLDSPWNGVSENGSELSISNQPGQSFVQIVYGNDPLDIIPEAWDESRFTMDHLSEIYVSNSEGNILTTYQNDFTIPEFTGSLADPQQWIAKGYDDNGDVLNKAQGVRLFGRMYVGGTEGSHKNTILWMRDRVSMVSDELIIRADIGRDYCSHEMPRIGFIYRDDNGHMLSTSAFPNGRFCLYAENNPSKPHLILKGDRNIRLWEEDRGDKLKESQHVKFVITKQNVSMEFTYPGENTLGSGDHSHGLNLSGTGRVGLIRHKLGPAWYDNLVVNSDPITEISMPVMPQSVAPSVKLAGSQLIIRGLDEVNKAYDITIYDYKGKLLVHKKLVNKPSMFINLENTNAGAFLVAVKGRDVTVVQKILITD